jgi:hypothetical protein
MYFKFICLNLPLVCELQKRVKFVKRTVTFINQIQNMFGVYVEYILIIQNEYTDLEYMKNKCDKSLQTDIVSKNDFFTC